MSTNLFTKRLGIQTEAAQITTHYDAPIEFRLYLLQLMKNYEPSLKKVRNIVSFITRIAEDPNQWGENSFMEDEIRNMLLNAPWNRIYDLVEYFYSQKGIKQNSDFEADINDYFIEKGYGWKMKKGIIKFRGEGSFEQNIQEVSQELKKKHQQTSHREISLAISDISKRPDPDITGAIQHSMAALECLSREVTGDRNSTLGKLVNDNKTLFPQPLGDVVTKLYGFSSEQGRHLKEGKSPQFDEAKLCVNLSAALCIYIARKLTNSND